MCSVMPPIARTFTFRFFAMPVMYRQRSSWRSCGMILARFLVLKRCEREHWNRNVPFGCRPSCTPTTAKAAFVGDPGPGLALYMSPTQDFVLGFHVSCFRHSAIGPQRRKSPSYDKRKVGDERKVDDR